jgi:predicted transposase/invertase (TIGR01784 family)
MLELGNLKETRFYQEAKQEGELKAKLAAVPRLLQQGLTIEAIAEALDLSLEDVRKAVQQ